MTKDIVKEGFALAEDEGRKKQVEEVKKIVLKTLEKIDEKSKYRKELDEEIRLLKMDIDDLKEGKLDRIVERQEKDEKAKKTSVVIIIKEKEVIREYNPWYWPYRIQWQPYDTTPAFCSSGTNSINIYGGSTSSTCMTLPTINCSVAKDSVTGTYSVNDAVVHLR